MATYATNRFLLRLLDRVSKPWRALSPDRLRCGLRGLLSRRRSTSVKHRPRRAHECPQPYNLPQSPPRKKLHSLNFQNVSRMVVKAETNTRLLNISSNPAPGTKFDTPVVITIFSVKGGRY